MTVSQRSSLLQLLPHLGPDGCVLSPAAREIAQDNSRARPAGVRAQHDLAKRHRRCQFILWLASGVSNEGRSSELWSSCRRFLALRTREG